MGIVLALEDKFQAFTGSFSDRAGRGEKQRLSALSTNWDLGTDSLSSAHNCAEPGKNEPLISKLSTPSFVSAVTGGSVLK